MPMLAAAERLAHERVGTEGCMRPTGLVSAAMMAIVLASDLAGASTPLPDPPFPGGGFVPPTEDVLKKEDLAWKMLASYRRKRAACDYALIDDLHLAYTPANPTKIAAVQEKWNTCVAKVSARFDYERDRLLAKGAPACLDAPLLDSLRAALEGLVAAEASVVFCDDDGAAPDPVTGLDVPDKKQEVTGEVAVAKLVVKSAYETTRCHMNVLRRIVRDGGSVTPDHELRLASCLGKIATKASGAIADLEQTQKLPACLPAANALAVSASAGASSTVLTGAIYCASPSGAFVDGLPVL
jgi:hypothetical protein